MKKLITLTAILALISTASFAQNRHQQYGQNGRQDQTWSNNGGRNNNYNNAYSYQGNAGYGDRDDHGRKKYDRDGDRDDRYRGDRDRDDRYRGDRDRDDRRYNRGYGYNQRRTRASVGFQVILGGRRNW
jgi:hypothetical protein